MKWRGTVARAVLGVVPVLLFLTGCAQAPKPLYLWETFPKQQYSALLRESVSGAEQIDAMQAHAEKARAAGAALPPGFRAHLGFLQLSAGQPDKAREAWMAERVAFPESAAYIDRILTKLMSTPATVPAPAALTSPAPVSASASAPATNPTKAENPA